MNAPLTLAKTSGKETLAPSRVRAHLLHRVRAALEAEALRSELEPAAGSLPRPYWQQALGTPLRDFLGRGSKMIRAAMTEWAWKAAGGAGALEMAFPLAVESLHAGSLIIDDIEDEAVTRRGDAALHRRYGLATALNAGNWLYFWPARLIEEAGLPPERELAALKKLGETQYRCHLGQGLDVSLKVPDIHQVDMADLVASKTALKTGALMGLSTHFGALAAGAPDPVCQAFARFGEELGTVLQMLDDAGTIFSDSRAEKAREDLVMGTPTWPWAWAAQQLDGNSYQQLVGLSYDVQTGKLDYTFLRGRLRQCLPHDLEAQLCVGLEQALNEIGPAISNPASVEAIHREFERMCHAYV